MFLCISLSSRRCVFCTSGFCSVLSWLARMRRPWLSAAFTEKSILTILSPTRRWSR